MFEISSDDGAGGSGLTADQRLQLDREVRERERRRVAQHALSQEEDRPPQPEEADTIPGTQVELADDEGAQDQEAEE